MKKRAARHLARIAFLLVILAVGALVLCQYIPGCNYFTGSEASFADSILAPFVPANLALFYTEYWASVITLPILVGVAGLIILLWLIHHVTLIAKHRGDQWGLNILFLLGGLVAAELLVVALEPGYMVGFDPEEPMVLIQIISDSEAPFWVMLVDVLPFVLAAIALVLFLIALFVSFAALSRRGAKKDSEYDVYKYGRKLQKAHRGASDDLNKEYIDRDEEEYEPKKSRRQLRKEQKAAERRKAAEIEPERVTRVPATPAPTATDADAHKALDDEAYFDEEASKPAASAMPVINQYFGYGFEPKQGEKALTAEDIRAVVAEELAKVPAPEAGLKEEEVKGIVAEELGKVKEDEAERRLIEEQRAEALANQIKEQDEKIAALEEKIVPAEVIRQIIAEELAKCAPVAPAPEPEPEPEPAPEPEPEPEPAPEPEPIPEPVPEPVVVEEPAPAPAPAPARVPFASRILDAEDELRENYNELKAECISYGLKSRLSNSGDTFRLHTKTYVKITVAGKGLKLYFALDPKDYANTPITLKDVSSKNVYKDIPACFKVKSGLAMRRAKQLLADACAKDGLVQGLVEEHNYARDLKDYKPQNSADDDLEEDEE